MDVVWWRVSVTIAVPDTVHEQAKQIAKEKDMTIKEAVRHMAQEGGYDV